MPQYAIFCCEREKQRMHYLYKIARVDSDDVYVGVTNDPFKRWQEHFENDSVVGRCLREHGLAGFAFSFIGVYVSRADAENAERIWIQENNPNLNAAARTGLASGLDMEKLADNEHFQILALNSQQIVAKIKVINDEQRIPITMSDRQLFLLAPRTWWKEFLGENLTRRHTQEIADAMIQVARKQEKQMRTTVDKATETNDIRPFVETLLSLRVPNPASPSDDISVADALLSNSKIADDYGIRYRDGKGLYLATQKPEFRALWKDTGWEQVDIKKHVKESLPRRPACQAMRFGKKFSGAPILITENDIAKLGLLQRIRPNAAGSSASLAG